MTAAQGWAAVLCSCVCFGSFGVPIKNPSVLRARVHPLVFQSYKTLWVLLTCPVSLLFVSEPQFTWWGVVSGFFWVPGGIAAVISVTNVGLAVGQGTWSCLIVIVAFSWGAFFFKEPLKSLSMSMFAVLVLMVGLVGMSCFASQSEPDMEGGDDNNKDRNSRRGTKYSKVVADSPSSSPGASPKSTHITLEADPHAPPFGLSRSSYGLIAAIFNGLWGGSSMVPLKLVSQAGYQGAEHVPIGIDYVVSFAVGSAIVNIVLWMALIVIRYYALLQYQNRPLHQASEPPPLPLLPQLHCSVMALPGMWAGVMWAAGNFFSIIAVLNLGQAVGYSSVQASILVSGLWGMFYFKEIPQEQLGRWLASAVTATVGIVLLMYERAS